MSGNLYSEQFAFSEWPNRGLPAVSAGVYAVWKGDDLIYCGMSGREIATRVDGKSKKYGLVTRLASHASGRLSGDQFCVYVANRFVVPSIPPDAFTRFASGEVSLDKLTRHFIHSHLKYSYALCQTSAEAYAIERSARLGDVFDQKPYLNPL